MTTPPGLRAWAELAGPARVLAAARAKLETGHSGPRSVLDVHLTAAERREVGRLLGTTWEASAKAVGLKALRTAVARHGVSLEEVLEDIGGPVGNTAVARAAAERRRRADRDEAMAILAEVLPGHEDVVGQVVRTSLRADERTSGARVLAAVLREVPDLGAATGRGATAPEPELLPVLAARVCGDAHALDRGTRLGGAAARLIAGIRGCGAEPGAGDGGEGPGERGAAAWRDTWSSVGVECDEVSSTVLTLGLELGGESPAARWSRVARGEPLWLTLRSLGSEPPAPAAGVREVFVCENPSVVQSAARALGARCAPLVCTFGRPGVAALRLLAGLAGAGVVVRVRADGDETGRAIVADLCARFATAEPWRMADAGYEEQDLDELLADLGRAGA